MKRPLFSILLIFASATQLFAITDSEMTEIMMRFLNDGVLLSYDPHQVTFLHQQVPYRVINGDEGDLSQDPIAFIAAGPLSREIITLHPDRSPMLQKQYENLVQKLSREAKTFRKGKLPLPYALKCISEYVKREIFSPALCQEESVDHFKSSWMAEKERTLFDYTITQWGKPFPVIPLNDFVSARVGVCRHLALACAYLLDKIAQEESGLLPPGSSHVVRDKVSNGRADGYHAWTIFVPDGRDEAWHIDATWQVVQPMHDQVSREILKDLYGNITISHLCDRFL